MSKDQTRYRDWEVENNYLAVDPNNCAPITKDEKYINELDKRGKLLGRLDSDGNFVKSENYEGIKKDSAKWTRLQFTLFNMFVSSSIFASYSVLAFYTTFLYAISSKVRFAFIFNTHMAFFLEITDARILIRLFEACYMYRYEQDLYHEEESYRMIQDIFRSPGLFKQFTGTCLRGTLDPSLDNLKQDVKKKLQRLERLEQKGFDVAVIRENILKEQEENVRNEFEKQR